MIPWLVPHVPFPPLDTALAKPNGLLAAGGELSPHRLIEAYRGGIFPWFNEGEPILWWSPDPRMVILPNELRVSRSLNKILKKRNYEIRAFLADAFFTERGLRDRVQMKYVTPLEGAFTKPVASKYLGSMLDQRHIALEADFMVESVDAVNRRLVSFDGREVEYDLLVTVPVNMGADYIALSGLGDELNYVPVDKETLLSNAYPNIFAVGDASNIPASKAGSVAHFSIDLFVDNFVEHVHGRPMTEKFDGHANCFVETGHGKGLLIDFNYLTEPLPGKYPVPGIGPFSLLKETEVNHWGKLGFRWMYWNVLLPGRPTPLPAAMSMAGKHADDETE